MDIYGSPTGETYTETKLYLNGIEFVGEGTVASRLSSINPSSNGRKAYEAEAAESRIEYYHTDHLGNVRLAFSDLDGDNAITVRDIYYPANEIVQERHYYPFGLTHTGPWFATVAPDNAYRYNGKELDEATGQYFYGFRMYDPAIARFTGVDPIADQFPHLSVYNYASNDPVGKIDLHGLQGISVNKRLSEIAFAIRHPIAAVAIGDDKPGSFRANISTHAANFAINLTNDTDMSKGPQGSDRNALRHTLWQAMITKKFDKEIANEAGLAHEGLTVPKVAVSSSGEYVSSTLEDADSWADLLNNKIGQEIGSNSPNASNKDLATIVLHEFANNGLWTVTETDDGFLIQRTKINENQLRDASGKLQPLYYNGLKKKEEKPAITRFGEM